MKLLNLNKHELYDVYTKEVRSIVEFVVTASWHSSLTNKQRSKIESAQKLAFELTAGKFHSYFEVCIMFGAKMTRTLSSLCKEKC